MRTEVFSLRVSPTERQLIEQLAAREERSPSDVVRRLIRKAANESKRAPADRQDGALSVSRP